MPISNSIKDILSSRFLQRIKFGGIVGKLALLGIIGAVGIASIGLRTSDPGVHKVCVIGAIVFLLLMAGCILAFGLKYPEQATLEGTEVIAFEHVQQMRTKELPNPVQMEQIEGLGMGVADSGKRNKE